MQFMELVPDYYDDFHCQCGACSHTCCQEWQISITEKDYFKMMSLPLPPEDHALLEKTVVRDLNKRPGHLFAAIHFNEDGRCGFYTADGLCRLQQIVGEENLPEVCRRFPRTAALVLGGTLEKEYRLDCPAVVELLLKKREGIHYLTRPTDETVAYRFVGRLKGHKHQRYLNLTSMAALPSYLFSEETVKENLLMRYYWEIKTLLIGVLQNRDYTIQQRILYMGVLLRTLEKLDMEGRVDEAGALALAEMGRENLEDIMATLERFPTNDPLALDWLSNLVSLRSPLKKGSASIVSELCKVRMRLKINFTDGKFMVSRSALKEGKRRFAEYCDSHPHVAENVAVAIFQMYAMPFGGIYRGSDKSLKINLWRNYRWYCAHFAVWQLFMRARFVEDTPDDKEIARLTSIIFRTLPNQDDIVVQVEQNMTPGVIADPLEIISILIK